MDESHIVGSHGQRALLTTVFFATHFWCAQEKESNWQFGQNGVRLWIKLLWKLVHKFMIKDSNYEHNLWQKSSAKTCSTHWNEYNINFDFGDISDCWNCQLLRFFWEHQTCAAIWQQDSALYYFIVSMYQYFSCLLLL